MKESKPSSECWESLALVWGVNIPAERLDRIRPSLGALAEKVRRSLDRDFTGVDRVDGFRPLGSSAAATEGDAQ